MCDRGRIGNWRKTRVTSELAGGHSDSEVSITNFLPPSSSMPSNTPPPTWIATLNGEVCASYTPYDDVIDEEAEPNRVEHFDWNRITLESELMKTPEVADELWEGILALWRLRLVEEKGAFEESWQCLVSAWLVRSCCMIVMIGTDAVIS